QRARHRRRPRSDHASGGHSRAGIASRKPAGHARQVLRIADLARAESRILRRHHLQRRRESPHARDQRGSRIRADIVRGRLEEGPEMTLLTDELTITEMVVPASVKAPDADEFLAMVDLANE